MSKDYYMNFENAYHRLVEEYHKYDKLIVAVDFDDTIYNTYKKQDRTYNQVIELLRNIKEYVHIVIWSASPASRFPEIENYCKDNDIPYDGINVSLVRNTEPTSKIYANIFIDDRAGLGEAYCLLSRLYEEEMRGLKNDSIAV